MLGMEFGVMANGHAGADYPRVMVHTVENGWVVVVCRSSAESGMHGIKAMLKGIVPAAHEIERIAGKGAMAGVESELENWKQESEDREKQLDDDINNAQTRIEQAFDGEPVEPPFRVYVFFDRNDLLAFLATNLQDPGVATARFGGAVTGRKGNEDEASQD